jgi:hypothetical protein
MRQAVERSSRQAISRISLLEVEEDALLQLVARLEGIELAEKDVLDGSTRRDKEVTSMSRSAFMKKLIADNRASMKHKLEMQHLSAERVAARLRGSIGPQQMSAVYVNSSSAATTATKAAPKAFEDSSRKAPTRSARLPLHAPPPPTRERTDGDTLPCGNVSRSAIIASPGTKIGLTSPLPLVVKTPSSVRVSASLMKAKAKGGGDVKLLVIPRGVKVAHLLTLLRGKFNASSKYNVILWGSDKHLLRDEDVANIIDGDSVILAACTKQELDALATKPRSYEEQEPASVPGANAEATAPVVSSNPAALEQVEQASEAYILPNEATAEESEFPIEANLTSRESVAVVKDTQHAANARAMESSASSSVESLQLKEAWLRRREQISAGLVTDRETLPIYAKRQEIVSNVRQHKVVLIAGATGSGKTTQVPQYILEDMIIDRGIGNDCYIVCTQPRRVAAVSVAERVAYETHCDSRWSGKTQGENAPTAVDGDEILHGLVGYQVRLETSTTKNTRLLFCTTGVLLNKLQDPDFLGRVSHIVLDEVHERGVSIPGFCSRPDFLVSEAYQNNVLLPGRERFLDGYFKTENFGA